MASQPEILTKEWQGRAVRRFFYPFIAKEAANKVLDLRIGRTQQSAAARGAGGKASGLADELQR